MGRFPPPKSWFSLFRSILGRTHVWWPWLPWASLGLLRLLCVSGSFGWCVSVRVCVCAPPLGGHIFTRGAGGTHVHRGGSAYPYP